MSTACELQYNTPQKFGTYSSGSFLQFPGFSLLSPGVPGNTCQRNIIPREKLQGQNSFRGKAMSLPVISLTEQSSLYNLNINTCDQLVEGVLLQYQYVVEHCYEMDTGHELSPHRKKQGKLYEEYFAVFCPFLYSVQKSWKQDSHYVQVTTTFVGWYSYADATYKLPVGHYA